MSATSYLTAMPDLPTDTAPSAEAHSAALFEALRPDLLRFACWLCRDQAMAEDVVQEALLRAWKSRNALNDPSAVRPWLMTIVRREHARLYRRKRFDLVDIDSAVESEDGALAQSDASEETGLRAAILKLPVEYREPLLMQVVGGLSADEIGRELNMTRGAVLTRLFRARNRLRVAYGLTEAPDPAPAERKP